MHILNINLERYSLILHGSMKIEGGGSLEAVIYQPNYRSSTKLHVIAFLKIAIFIEMVLTDTLQFQK